MKIGFLDPIDWDYRVESAYQIPLGGSQSALCYLTEALAKQRHDVFLFNATKTPGKSRGVECLSLPLLQYRELLRSLDAFIVLNRPVRGREIRSIMGEKTRFVLWTQHEHDAEPLQVLQESGERDVYDGIVLISEWQRQKFYQHFGISLDKMSVLRNAIAPSFCNLFSDNTPIFSQKSQPPILAYTSTPFRGLDILLAVFPKIREAIPGVRLKVFSSLKVYQFPERADWNRYGQLYRQCKETEGVEYIGSLPQPELARELRSVSVFAYPNTLPETSCIAVMEAMASGCLLVTSALAALPETTAGFARLISVEDVRSFATFYNWNMASKSDWQAYSQRFTDEAIATLKEYASTDTTPIETHLKQQVEYINRHCTWTVRAQQWV